MRNSYFVNRNSMQSAIFPGVFLPQRKTYQGTFLFFHRTHLPNNSSRTSVRLGAWILVSEADIFFTESLRILAERLSQSENGLPTETNLLLLTT